MSQQESEFAEIDPRKRQAIEMWKELSSHPPRDQAILLIRLRQRDPDMADDICRLMKTETSLVRQAEAVKPTTTTEPEDV